jgi:hypothetical protein
MLRHLYRCAVRLHPSSFRRRFGDEMLYVFDQQKGVPAALGLMLDCGISLFRQWALRPHSGIELSVAQRPTPADHIPSFETLDSFRPRASALINGAALSLILFCMTVIAIRHSWVHVLNLHIREIGTDWDQQAPAQVRPSRSVWLQLDPYVGEYISKSPPAKILIRIDGDHLSLAFAGHPSLALSPLSPKRFIIDGTASNYADFTSDSLGRICCLSLLINDKGITAQR